MRKFSSLLLGACAAGAMFAGSGAASATTLTFDGAGAGTTGAPVASPYVENGYQFANGSGFFSWGPGNASTSDPSGSSSTLLEYNGNTTTTLTRVDGAAFDFDSIDFDDVSNSGIVTSLTLSYVLAGGGTGSVDFTTNGTPGLETLHLGLIGLLSASWVTHASWAQFDNVQVQLAATPLPGALLLFASALGTLGFASRRRRNQAA